MTYCLALKINEGLIFCSDSRTNAGVDRVNTYSKLHRFTDFPDRRFALLSAGNLATTQAVVELINRDLKENKSFNINKAEYLSDVADYVGKLSVQIQKKYANTGPTASSFDATATFILGGQIGGQETGLYMIYPEGNHIGISEQSPFLQIGEIKYGKPILDRIIRPDTPYETALRCALVSMDSTMRSNATVGPPIELLYFPTNLGMLPIYLAFEENDDYLVLLRKSWDDKIREAFNQIPDLTQIIAGRQGI